MSWLVVSRSANFETDMVLFASPTCMCRLCRVAQIAAWQLAHNQHKESSNLSDSSIFCGFSDLKVIA